MNKNTHGGKRKGAGRPRKDVRRLNVTLDAVTIAKLKRLGGGNLSEGIRKAASML
jgi:hypothetical protein